MSGYFPDHYPGPEGDAFRQRTFHDLDLLIDIQAMSIKGTYLDCGAGVGNYAVFFGLHCPASAVYAFTPDPVEYEHLLDFYEANWLYEKIRPSLFLPFDKEGDVDAYSAEAGFMLRTQAIVLDDYFKEPIGLIRLGLGDLNDRALAGASRLIREYAPAIVLDEERPGIVAALTHLGYVRNRYRLFRKQIR